MFSSNQLVYSNSFDAVYEAIAPNFVLTICGTGTVTVKSIGRNALIEKTGPGNLIIEGQIESGVIIQTENSGGVIINSNDIHEDVKFILKGTGDVVFRHRPPQTVIDTMQKTGLGCLIIEQEQNLSMRS